MKLSVADIRKIIREEYARGIPDFAISQIATDCAEDTKRQLVRFINQKSANPQQQRQLLSAANLVTKDLEKEIKEKIEEKLLDFLQRI